MTKFSNIISKEREKAIPKYIFKMKHFFSFGGNKEIWK